MFLKRASSKVLRKILSCVRFIVLSSISKVSKLSQFNTAFLYRLCLLQDVRMLLYLDTVRIKKKKKKNEQSIRRGNMKLLTFILILKVILLLFVSTYYFYNNFNFLSFLFINSSQLIIYFYIFKDLIFDYWKNSKLSTVINDFLRKLYFLNIFFISFNYTLIIFMIKSQNGIN